MVMKSTADVHVGAGLPLETEQSWNLCQACPMSVEEKKNLLFGQSEMKY